MARTPNIHGGGAQTNINGLGFERHTNLLEAIGLLPDCSVEGNQVFRDGEIYAEHYSKHGLYKLYLEPKNINWEDFISSKLLPDDVFIIGNTCYILEKKTQSTSGSVDEKLQVFPFKRLQYLKMFSQLDMNVEIHYLLDGFFNKPKYRDTFEYMNNNGTCYFFTVDDLLEYLRFI